MSQFATDTMGNTEMRDAPQALAQSMPYSHLEGREHNSSWVGTERVSPCPQDATTA